MESSKINIMYFGITHDIANAGEEAWEIEEKMTVGDLKKKLEEKFPKFRELRSFAVAVNEEYASDEHLLKDRDEVAIIPPVSGG